MNTSHYESSTSPIGLSGEAIAMMENGRPTPRRERRKLVQSLLCEWSQTLVCFGENDLKPLDSSQALHGS
ncbi:MAG: hypothetical protein ACFCUX_01295 [Candidatus Methylacidiphilales bacterium]